MDAADFHNMMEEIDADLRREGVRIDRRQIEGFTRVCQRLQIGLTLAPLGEPAIAGKYDGDSLSAHILGWFDARYGDRLKMEFSVAQVVAVIRDDPWRLRIPRVFGTVRFVCDRQLATYRGRPSFSSDGTIPTFNILNAIEDLPDGLAESLRRDELDALVFFFVSAGQAVVALEEILRSPLIPESRDDLSAAVEHLLSKPSANCGFSKWSSLQFVEKLIKSYLETKSTPYKKTHDLNYLAGLAAQSGLGVDRNTLRAVQCTPEVRYDSKSVTMGEALAAHHGSLALCYEIACRILSRPATVKWTVGIYPGA